MDKVKTILKLTVRLLSLAIMLCRIAEATPVTLFNSFGPGDTYTVPAPAFGGGTLGIPLGTAVRIGDPFTPSISATLDSIDLAIVRTVGMQFTVWLMTDSGGQPSTILETFQLSGPFTLSIVDGQSATHPALQAGVTYWLIAGPVNLTDASLGAWLINPQGLTAPLASQQYTQTTAQPWMISSGQPELAFRLTGEAAIPEPTTITLLITGLLAMLGAGSFGRHSDQAFASDPRHADGATPGCSEQVPARTAGPDDL